MNMHEDETDYKFNMIVSTMVLNTLTTAFNDLITKSSLYSPLIYDEHTEKYLQKKAQKTKYVLCTYIDGLVENYSKTRLKRSQLSDDLDSQITNSIE